MPNQEFGVISILNWDKERGWNRFMMHQVSVINEFFYYPAEIVGVPRVSFFGPLLLYFLSYIKGYF